MSFILENDLSQPCNRNERRQQDLQSDLQIGEHVISTKRYKKLQDSHGVKSTAACLFDNFFCKTIKLTIDIIWECYRKTCTFLLQVGKVTGISIHECFCIQPNVSCK